MTINEFDRLKGIFSFEISDIKTAFHAHPATEFLFNKDGGITIETPTTKFENIYFAIIGSNLSHKTIIKKENTELLMIECNAVILQKVLSNYDIRLKDNIYIEAKRTNKANLIKQLPTLFKQDQVTRTSNIKVQECLEYLNNSVPDYKHMIEVLKLKTNLSESRISHVFKEQIGLSLKKYLVWSRLKQVFEIVISGKMNMYEAALYSGFYDQAHLSKAFKQMLGLSPSEIYNSRMLQV